MVYYNNATFGAYIVYRSETLTVWKVNLESFKMWCWRRMETSMTDLAKNAEVLRRVNEKRNILHTIQRRKANSFGHILHSKCLLKHVALGRI